MGVFSIVSFVVARRTREIAIRVALGATPRNVLRLVMRDVALAAALGATAGFAVGWWLVRLIRHLLFGVSATDLITPSVAAACLVALVLAAAWFAARRALRLDPAVTLRVD
jgi:ABC-type antimicrobial peptide transport system permease subunit